ncbi:MULTISPECIES: tryptophanase [unclassified Fusibacter]|uniref:tryptophanase n=1 Tax=unclassified Fusibacter TaxID=2624464 RepID=UPI00101227FC|nr:MULTISPECIES: tryptophanase [unclassified Fusibacter]MCK8060319.1 tryptophanase [Fusibacter sp. A2]NPE20392.1 tryptophanase [Fusibacter sp. A1]RXV63596.1 tyrosine phenol-lyase [Fusibacter sp. A1]
MIKYVAEPFKIKMVEPLKMTTREQREEYLKAANYNVFGIDSDNVYIDCLTDSGTGAMSDAQWAGMMMGDESYAGARGYRRLLKAVTDIFGYEFGQPVHQGRAAEQVLLPLYLKKGQKSVSNMHFDTTRGHVGLLGAKAVDIVVPEAKDTSTYLPFKGNMDLVRLEKYIQEVGAETIGIIIMTVTNNSAGGQPVSMENIRETKAIADKYGIPMILDAARYAENAHFIREREEGYADVEIIDIVREMFSYAEAFTMSAKKDAIVNMGGLIGIKNSEELYVKVKGLTIPYEGFVTYGGLAGRDLEALSIGLYEGLDKDYLKYRIGQIEYLGGKLKEMGVPFQYPVGGHAVFLDAKALLPHIPYHQFPGQALACELYLEAGIRSCDIGSYLLDLDPETGEQLEAEMEFTRLAIPRRVYTQAHFDVIAEALKNIKERASEIKGYEILWQAPVLRHFTAKLRPIEDK